MYSRRKVLKIFVNSKEEEKEISIAELLKKKNIHSEVVTVELNEKIIDRKDYQTYVALKKLINLN